MKTKIQEIIEVKQPKGVRSMFNRRRRVGIHTGEGLTEQSHKDECDINCILRDYQRTGLLKHAKDHQGRYDDITVQDFQEAMNTVTQAQQMFSELPSSIRKKFHQDPSLFLEYVHDKNNLTEMQRMGILKGNDGIDIKGTPVNSPTEDDVKKSQQAPSEPGKSQQAPPTASVVA